MVGQGRHVTLFFKTNLFKTLGRKVVLDILDILRKVLNPFEIASSAPVAAAGVAEAPAKVSCVACMENDLDCQFLPCRHICTCMSCASRVSVCPSCRATIASREKVFIQHA
jgi:hypothetical protein